MGIVLLLLALVLPFDSHTKGFALRTLAQDRQQPPTAREIARDTYLLPGAILPQKGPDGNTIIYVAPDGLIVVDTGRHAWHSDGILNFARERKLPVVAIINTHWHLDHSSGNARIKAVYPKATIYTTSAVNRALAPGGFLDRSFQAAKAKPVDANAPAAMKEETDVFFDTMAHQDRLRPDVTVEKTATLKLAGRSLSVRVAPNAVTDADIWIYDESTGVAAIGDLVTLPAPFFESACPAKWQDALDQVWATPFKLAIPGHGAPMTREQFDTYRGAYKNFLACVASDNPAATCAAGWTKDAGPLLESDADRRGATGYANYYVDFLRKGHGTTQDCLIK
jgi:glyoxylase-like metal-dependent hydrolase (beta-lactamase superfamily II)